MECRLVCSPVRVFIATLDTRTVEWLLCVDFELASAPCVAASTACAVDAGKQGRSSAVPAERDLELFSARVAACWAHLADWRSTTIAQNAAALLEEGVGMEAGEVEGVGGEVKGGQLAGKGSHQKNTLVK